jgi:hypothetical protein
LENYPAAPVNISPILILGTQRSGTTLLTRILSAYSELFIQNEINVHRVFKSATLKTEIVEALDNEITMRQNETIKQLLEKSSKRLWGVKDPQLTEYISQLKLFLPDSKFIIIICDAREVVSSYKKNKWGLGTNVYTDTLRWLDEVTQQKEFMRESPEHFLILKYEDILKNTSSEIEKVCRHLEVKFEQNMLDYHLKKAQYKQNKSNINTDKKLDVSFAEKWKKELTPHEIDIIEHLLKDGLQSCGYTLAGNPIKVGFIAKSYYKLHQLIVGEFQIQFQLKRLNFKQKIKTWVIIK